MTAPQKKLLARINRCPKGYALMPSEDKTADILRDKGLIFIDERRIARIIESFGGEMMGKQLYSQIKELKNVSQATAERAVAFAASPLVNMVTSRPVVGRGNGRIFSLVDTSGEGP